MGIVGEVEFNDGSKERLELLYNMDRCLYFNAGDCYLVVPWADVSNMSVSLEDFMEAQKKAKEDTIWTEIQ